MESCVDKFWKFIESLCRYDDGEEKESNSDPHQRSINCVQGKGFELAIRFGVMCNNISSNKYQNEIKEFIKENKVITLGCNYINKFFIPDYHFWGDRYRYLKYGKNIDKNSVLVFGEYISSTNTHLENQE